jgi:Sulfotransferase family
VVVSDPHVLIVGCARSGTTLLQRILDAHPEIAVTPSVHWITRHFRERNIRKPEDPVTPEAVFELLENPRFTRFKIQRAELAELVGSHERLTYARFLASIFELYGKAEGKPLIGNKTAPFVRSIPTLHNLWPEAKFVHLIRDGRDVCLSVLNWERATKLAGRLTTWRDDPVTTAALWWEWNVRLGREDGWALGSDLYREVRYESLIADPVEECVRLSGFLGLPYDDAMLRFHEGKTRTEPGLNAKQAWLPVTSGLRNWRSEMPADHVERFEAAAGDLLEELGYGRIAPSTSTERFEHAAKVRDVFTRDVRSRGKRLPQGWRN